MVWQFGEVIEFDGFVDDGDGDGNGDGEDEEIAIYTEGERLEEGGPRENIWDVVEKWYHDFESRVMSRPLVGVWGFVDGFGFSKSIMTKRLSIPAMAE